MRPEEFTVLLAEDDLCSRSLFEVILRRQGFKVLSAVDGSDALNIARTHSGPIHLLLSDIEMPGLNGTELARILCTSRAETKVLLMSGYSETILPSDLGWTFLGKPLLPSVLTRTVHELLGGAAPAGMNRSSGGIG